MFKLSFSDTRGVRTTRHRRGSHFDGRLEKFIFQVCEYQHTTHICDRRDELRSSRLLLASFNNFSQNPFPQFAPNQIPMVNKRSGQVYRLADVKTLKNTLKRRKTAKKRRKTADFGQKTAKNSLFFKGRVFKSLTKRNSERRKYKNK